MPKFVHEPYSGVRLPHDEQFPFQLQRIARALIGQYKSLFNQAHGEQWYVDDAIKQIPLDTLLMGALQDGELFIHKLDDIPIGFSVFTNVLVGRSACFEGYVVPQIRRTGVAQILGNAMFSYAFETLGLQKLKCEIAAHNEPSWRFCEGMGFQQVGQSPADFLGNGEVSDKLYFELFNPVTFYGQIERGEQAQSEPDAADIHSADSGAVPRLFDSSNDVARLPVSVTTDGASDSSGQETERDWFELDWESNSRLQHRRLKLRKAIHAEPTATAIRSVAESA